MFTGRVCPPERKLGSYTKIHLLSFPWKIGSSGDSGTVPTSSTGRMGRGWGGCCLRWGPHWPVATAPNLCHLPSLLLPLLGPLKASGLEMSVSLRPSKRNFSLAERCVEDGGSLAEATWPLGGPPCSHTGLPATSRFWTHGRIGPKCPASLQLPGFTSLAVSPFFLDNSLQAPVVSSTSPLAPQTPYSSHVEPLIP